MKTIQTKNAEETKALAKSLSQQFLNGGIIALSGDLGAGKTTFAQGFAQGIGINNNVISPTFLIIRQYPIPNQKKMFYHIDLYRMENIDLVSSGLAEIFEDEGNIVLIEWAEKIDKDLPKHTTKINLKKLEENIHEITVS